MDELAPILVGFVLTTVLGGLLGTYLQQRTWEHQNEAHLREEELRHAGEVCQSVSGLLDKRRYRMQRLSYAIAGWRRGTVSEETLTEKLEDYDQVLYEWNDSFFTNRSMVGTYFGHDGRKLIDRVYQAYADVGSELEQAYRNRQESEPEVLDRLNQRLEGMTDITYRLNVLMMTWLREGTVGRRARRPLEPSEPD
ncbi:MAG TPA: hypothetical protein VEY96_00420 [Actinomycetes bacterium]|nr:hypothetical protein [Actinomycetes bacterium]